MLARSAAGQSDRSTWHVDCKKPSAMSAASHANSDSAADFLPDKRTLSALRRAVQDCRGCPLYQNATQAVFGEGPASARLMLIGEQPGDQEDLAGRPFVGPAGRLLRAALEEAGIAEKSVYVTNAVKHFKWTPRGKRRLHGKPSSRETSACRPWLEAEIAALEPRVIVCLGATAAQSLLGSSFRFTKSRGEILETDWSEALLCTYHPSAILRAPTGADRAALRELLVLDLRTASRQIAA
jgi:uracil-DNA glycosylase family protein